MKKLLLLALISLSLFGDSKPVAVEKATIETRLNNVENSFKEYDSFFDFQKDINLENKKLVNECTDNLANTKKLLSKVNDNSTYEEIGRLKSRIYSLETEMNRQDGKINRLEQRLNAVERRVK